MVEQTKSAGSAQENGQGLEYGPYYFRHDCGVPYERNSHWLEFFDKVAESIVRDLRPTTVLDAGCAMGFLVEALRKRGVEAWGVDISEYAISHVDESVSEHCRVASVTEPLGRRYDLIVCVEVLEHLPAAETPSAIANLCAATDRLLLSSTPYDFGEATHLNVQPPEAWSAALASEGFLRDVDRDASYLTPWAALYVRTEEPLSETVRRYDRTWWRLRREGDQLRDSLLVAQERMAELERREELDRRPELLAELETKQEEILRLRDLLIGKDAELGAAKGRLALLDDRSNRLDGATARVRKRVPGLGRLLAAALRILRGNR